MPAGDPERLTRQTGAGARLWTCATISRANCRAPERHRAGVLPVPSGFLQAQRQNTGRLLLDHMLEATEGLWKKSNSLRDAGVDKDFYEGR